MAQHKPLVNGKMLASLVGSPVTFFGEVVEVIMLLDEFFSMDSS
jgi:hypothetical protein